MAPRTKKTSKRNYSSPKKRAQQRESEYGSRTIKLPEGFELFKFDKPGVYRLDIIPYEVKHSTNKYAEPGIVHHEKTYYIHRNIGADDTTVVCPKSIGERCPICDEVARLRADPDSKELIDAIKAKERQLYNVIDVKNPSDGIQILDMSYFLFGNTLDAIINGQDEDDEEDYDKIFSPDEGYTLKCIAKQESMGDTKFISVKTIEVKARVKQHADSIIDDAADLDELLKVNSYDDLKALFLGGELDNDDEDEDEDEAPKPKTKSKPKPKPKATPADDDDADEGDVPWDDDDDDDDAEEEAAPKPKSKAKSKKAPPPEPDADDDDDEDWDDDDEEEEAPKPKAKGKAKSKPAPEPADEDDDDDWDDDDDEEEEEKPVKKSSKPSSSKSKPSPKPQAGKSGAKSKTKTKPAPADDDDDDDDDWDD